LNPFLFLLLFPEYGKSLFPADNFCTTCRLSGITNGGGYGCLDVTFLPLFFGSRVAQIKVCLNLIDILSRLSSGNSAGKQGLHVLSAADEAFVNLID
jgi:hypothetical protein